jgi:hypothetical protein
MPETEYAWGKRGQRSVSARKTRDGWDSTGISWQDYGSMSTRQHKQSGERRLPTPMWALDDKLLRELLVVFMETRLGIHNPTGTLLERRDFARAYAISDRPRHEANLDELNLRYVEESKAGAPPERLKRLEQEIENLDTFLRTTVNGGMDTVAGTVFLYHRCKFDSVGVGTELGLKPPHVRQILWRMNQVWKKRFNEDGTLKPFTPHWNARVIGVVHKAQKPMKWSPQEAIFLRIFGMSFLEIGERLGVCGAAVWMFFKEHGIVVPVIERTKPPRKHSGKARTIDTKRAAELHATGLTWSQIAKEVGAACGEGVLAAVKRDGLWVPTWKKKLAEYQPANQSAQQEPAEHGQAIELAGAAAA